MCTTISTIHLNKRFTICSLIMKITIWGWSTSHLHLKKNNKIGTLELVFIGSTGYQISRTEPSMKKTTWSLIQLSLQPIIHNWSHTLMLIGLYYEDHHNIGIHSAKHSTSFYLFLKCKSHKTFCTRTKMMVHLIASISWWPVRYK